MNVWNLTSFTFIIKWNEKQFFKKTIKSEQKVFLIHFKKFSRLQFSIIDVLECLKIQMQKKAEPDLKGKIKSKLRNSSLKNCILQKRERIC